MVWFSKGEVEVGELRGRNVPLEEREKERMFWEGEGRAEGMNVNGHGTGDPGQYPVFSGQRLMRNVTCKNR